MLLKSTFSEIACAPKAYVYSMPSFEHPENIHFILIRQEVVWTCRRTAHAQLASGRSSLISQLLAGKNLKEVDDAEKDRVDDVSEETNSAGLSQPRRVRLHG